MILTGSEIIKEKENKNIIITNFINKNLNPNSYNYRLSEDLIKITFDEKGQKKTKKIKIPQTGYVLEPNTLYLGSTYEEIGSDLYAMRLIGRSSLGRLGLFLQISADLGHVGSSHCWTLEIVACKKIKIYPKMRIGQVSFWDNKGKITQYQGIYTNFNNPKESELC